MILKFHYVEVTSEGEKIIGKKTGKYLTIEVLGIRERTQNCNKR